MKRLSWQLNDQAPSFPWPRGGHNDRAPSDRRPNRPRSVGGRARDLAFWMAAQHGPDHYDSRWTGYAAGPSWCVGHRTGPTRAGPGVGLDRPVRDDRCSCVRSAAAKRATAVGLSERRGPRHRTGQSGRRAARGPHRLPDESPREAMAELRRPVPSVPDPAANRAKERGRNPLSYTARHRGPSPRGPCPYPFVESPDSVRSATTRPATESEQSDPLPTGPPQSPCSPIRCHRVRCGPIRVRPSSAAVRTVLCPAVVPEPAADPTTATTKPSSQRLGAPWPASADESPRESPARPTRSSAASSMRPSTSVVPPRQPTRPAPTRMKVRSTTRQP